MAGRFQINHLYADIQDVEGIYDTYYYGVYCRLTYHSTLTATIDSNIRKSKAYLVSFTYIWFANDCRAVHGGF